MCVVSRVVRASQCRNCCVCHDKAEQGFGAVQDLRITFNQLKSRIVTLINQQEQQLVWKDPVWRMAAVVAVLLHVLLLSVSFVAPPAEHAVMQEITMAVHLSPQKVDNADFIAQADQQGAGSLHSQHRMTSPDRQPAERDQQQIADNIHASPQKQQQAAQVAEQVLVTTLSWKEHSRNEERKAQAKKQQSNSPDLARVAMIATLEAQYAKRKQEYSRKTNIRTVDSVSAKGSPEAAYMDRFRQKVEQLGNKHYPEEARSRNLHGDVRLMVILTPNGKIRAIRLLQTSGSGVLDEAAKSSVRQAAPFGKFDKQMKDVPELRIIRTWRFSAKHDELDVES